MFRNKRAVAPIAIAGLILLIVIIIYLMLYIPIPAFSSLRQTINYFLTLVLWIVFQFGIIYGAYKVIQYIALAYKTYKFKILGWATSVQKYILSH